jgi:hypothetical protein
LTELGVITSGGDPLKLSSTDWQDLADLALNINIELSETKHPERAIQWHGLTINRSAVFEHTGKAAAKGAFC